MFKKNETLFLNYDISGLENNFRYSSEKRVVVIMIIIFNDKFRSKTNYKKHSWLISHIYYI